MHKVAQTLRGVRSQVPRVRWLDSSSDADALRTLIQASYGDTYAHTSFYKEGVLESLWAHGSLCSMGMFSPDGDLMGHTGFWCKDPHGDFIESGLSLVHPQSRQSDRIDDKGFWRPMLKALADITPFLHQSTTTLHPMAQLYALHHLRATPAGLLPFYTTHERVILPGQTDHHTSTQPDAPMHALCMSTHLRPQEALPTATLPDGPWRTWLAALADLLHIPTQQDPHTPSRPEAQHILENNTDFGIQRRQVTPQSPGLDKLRQNPAPRLDLIHLQAAPGITSASNQLLAQGYLPVALRPHHSQVPHIVYQHLSVNTAQALNDAHLATDPIRTMWQDWMQLCKRTS